MCVCVRGGGDLCVCVGGREGDSNLIVAGVTVFSQTNVRQCLK